MSLPRAKQIPAGRASFDASQVPVRNRAPLANRPEFELHGIRLKESRPEPRILWRMKNEDLIPTLAILLPALKHSEASGSWPMRFEPCPKLVFDAVSTVRD